MIHRHSVGGRTIAIWVSSGEVKASSFASASGMWSAPDRVFPEGSEAQIAVGAAGNAHAVWQGAVGIGTSRKVVSSKWGASKLISSSSVAIAPVPQVAIDANFGPLAVWADTGAWLAAAPLSDSEGIADAFPYIATSRNGTAIAVWTQSQRQVWASRYQ